MIKKPIWTDKGSVGPFRFVMLSDGRCIRIADGEWVTPEIMCAELNTGNKRPPAEEQP